MDARWPENNKSLTMMAVLIKNKNKKLKMNSTMRLIKF